MNCFITLPHELVLLVLSYTTDKVDENLLCVNHKFLTMLNTCLSQERLWELRYSNTFHDYECCYTSVLPETSAYYGWRRLYYKVKDFDANKQIALRKSYVGPTGNIYFCYDQANNYYIKAHTCPILELVLMEEIPARGILVVYIAFDRSVRSYIVTDFKQGQEGGTGKWGQSYFVGPCDRYFMKNKVLILLHPDGSVICFHDKTKLRKVVDVVFNNLPPFYDATVIGPGHCLTLYNRQCTLHVNTFTVSYILNGVTQFTWPRTSPMYFEYLRKEMERLSVK